ncbi:hypothetical protein AAHH80_33135, partial [Burkholderia pseudomallei]
VYSLKHAFRPPATGHGDLGAHPVAATFCLGTQGHLAAAVETFNSGFAICVGWKIKPRHACTSARLDAYGL